VFSLDNVLTLVGYGLNRCLADVILHARFFPIWQSCTALRGNAIWITKEGDMVWCFVHPSCVCDHVFKTHWFNTLFCKRVKNYQLIKLVFSVIYSWYCFYSDQ